MEVDLTDSTPAVPDRRRRQWIPLSASFPFDTTGTRLLEEFGNDGIALWVAFLTACKRSPIQGRISYGSEAEGWAQLGLDPIEGLDLDTFWTFTGRIKKTRRTRRGRITNVICTVWGEWNNEPRTGSGRRQSAWSDGTFARQIGEEYVSEMNGNRALERESEIENENDREASGLPVSVQTQILEHTNAFRALRKRKRWSEFEAVMVEWLDVLDVDGLARALDIFNDLSAEGYADTPALLRSACEKASAQVTSRVDDFGDRPDWVKEFKV
jgi:hypothetical protein